jgi:chromosomal replication initiation ATPase DnaA
MTINIKSRYKNVFPFSTNKGILFWRVKVKVNGKFEFLGLYPFTDEGEKQASEKAKEARKHAKANSKVEEVIAAIKAGHIYERNLNELRICLYSIKELNLAPVNHSMAVIDKAVANYFHSSVGVIHEKSRVGELVMKRQISMYIMHKNKHTHNRIGKHFKKDRTTVIHSCKRVQDLIDTEDNIKIAVYTILNNLTHADQQKPTN